MEICGYPRSTAYGSKNLNAGECLSWQHLATAACEKEGQGLSPAAGWCHGVVAPAAAVPIPVSALWDTGLSSTAVIYSELTLLMEFPGSNSPQLTELRWVRPLQEPKEKCQKRPGWIQGGHERAESSQMRTCSLELLSFQGENHSSRKLMDLIEEIVCQC